MAEYHITNVTELQAMTPGHLADDCILDNDIDASATSGWNGGLGFVPVGTNWGGVRFTGNFDGQGHSIINLFINRPTEDYVGLFGFTESLDYIRNVTFVNANITGKSWVGALAGIVHTQTLVSNCHASGVVNGNGEGAGGLIGDFIGGPPDVVMRECSSTANVTNTGDWTGGLIGVARNGTKVYESKSYSGTVTGDDIVGGLIGYARDAHKTEDCYSKDSVNGDDDVGGLIGQLGFAAEVPTVNRCYSMGAVTGNTNVGGMIGGKTVWAVTTRCHWDIETSGQATSAGPELGHTTAVMQLQATYAFWDFATIWGICDSSVPPYPWLQWQEIICGTIPTAPTDLLCEQKTNPTDVIDPKPEFSAIFHGG